MYFRFVSPWLEHRVERRQRGGGGGGGGGSSGGGSGSAGRAGGTTGSTGRGSAGSTGSGGGGGSTGRSGGGTTGRSGGTPGSSIPITSGSGTSRTARPYGAGSTIVGAIPAGQPFSGRSIGGGTRSNVFGNRQYGSGYPGVGTASVAGRGFPFGYWPIAFGGAAALGVGSQFHTHEYGDPNNSSRPGGPLFDAPFQPPDGSNTYRILSDNSTVQSLIDSIKSNCSSLSTTSISAVPFNESDRFQPKPEQVIQYYRSSSISLTLDDYNNSAVFSNDTNAPDTPLPSNLNMTFLDCLNQTIGAAAPLLEGLSGVSTPNAPTLNNSARVQLSSLLALAWMSIHFLQRYSLL